MALWRKKKEHAQASKQRQNKETHSSPRTQLKTKESHGLVCARGVGRGLLKSCEDFVKRNPSEKSKSKDYINPLIALNDKSSQVPT